MNKIKKPELEENELGMNPFLYQLQIPVNKFAIAGQYMKDKDGVILPLEIEVEADVATRIYVANGRRKQMVTLSSRAKDLLLWLIYEAEVAKDWLWINYVRYMEESRVTSYNTYRSAVKELMMNGFIQLTVVNHVYWINPHFFFNGSRVNRFPDNVVRK